MISPSFPSAEELPLDKLESHPGSLILVAIQLAEERCNFTRTTFAWLSREERRALKVALTKCRKKREACSPAPHGDLATVGEGEDSGRELRNA